MDENMQKSFVRLMRLTAERRKPTDPGIAMMLETAADEIEELTETVSLLTENKGE